MDIHLEVYVKNVFASFSQGVLFEETKLSFRSAFNFYVFLIQGLKL